MHIQKVGPDGQPLTEAEVAKRRKEIAKSDDIYILHPKQVGESGEKRIRQWAAEIMRKHEKYFTPKYKHRDIVASGHVDPNNIDVGGIYPYPDLNWFIWKNNDLWSFTLLSGHRMLCNIDFAKI